MGLRVHQTCRLTDRTATTTESYNFDWQSGPSAGWALPIPTGHRYLAYFGAYGLDWTHLKIQVEPLWSVTDEVIEVFMNHTDIRAAITVNSKNLDGSLNLIPNLSYTETGTKNDWQMGSHLHLPDVADQEFYYVVDGRNQTTLNLQFDGIRCWDVCDDALIEGSVIQETQQLWSNTLWWAAEGKTYPLTGEDVEIPAHWNLLYDLDPVLNTEEFGTITIYGRLSFKEGSERTLRAHNIYLRGGEFLITQFETYTQEEEESGEEEEENCTDSEDTASSGGSNQSEDEESKNDSEDEKNDSEDEDSKNDSEDEKNDSEDEDSKNGNESDNSNKSNKSNKRRLD